MSVFIFCHCSLLLERGWDRSLRGVVHFTIILYYYCFSLMVYDLITDLTRSSLSTTLNVTC